MRLFVHLEPPRLVELALKKDLLEDPALQPQSIQTAQLPEAHTQNLAN
jgi:hypothetical protein